MKLSIITPSYNCVEFLEDALHSVKAQSWQSMEHIVVDGASTDGTRDILERYSQTPGWEHLRWISEPDKGQSDAINKGFRMATGDLMAWLNADDYLLPGSLEAIARYATDHPEVDIVYGDSIFVQRDGNLLRAKKEHRFDFGVLLYFGCYIQSNTTFYKRHVIQKDLLLDESYRVCMDYEYFVRLASKGETFGYCRRPIAAFRWHGANRSLETGRRWEERLQIQKKWGDPSFPYSSYKLAKNVFRMKRAAMKLVNGAYWGELKAYTYRGIDTRWFRSMAVQEVCRKVI